MHLTRQPNPQLNLKALIQTFTGPQSPHSSNWSQLSRHLVGLRLLAPLRPTGPVVLGKT